MDHSRIKVAASTTRKTTSGSLAHFNPLQVIIDQRQKIKELTQRHELELAREQTRKIEATCALETENIKVKELIIGSGKSMSFQKHFKRNEIWFVSEGSCTIFYSDDTDNKNIKELKLNKFDHYFVPVGHWHQITNPFSLETHIIEIQYGEECIESDIEREHCCHS